MFTGIVEHLGRMERLEPSEGGARLTIHAPEVAPDLIISGSIAVNGCCLTVVETNEDSFSADLSSETLHRTAFSEMKTGTVVNLERPLVTGKEFGGHFVQGHIDGVGRVARLSVETEDGAGPSAKREGSEKNWKQTERSWWLEVRIPDELRRYVAHKGSVAIDGISLTVAGWNAGVAQFAVIPFTYSRTNIHALCVGDAVHLECDILAKYVERLLEEKAERRRGSRLTVSRLIDEGF